MSRYAIHAIAVLSIVAPPLLAQQPHAIEAGVFARYTHYSSDIGLGDAAGPGVLAAYYLSPVLSIDADGSWSSSDVGALTGSHVPVHLRILLNLPFSERLSAFLGTGPVLDLYGKDLAATNLGLGTAAGARFGITSRVMLRLSGTWDWVMITQAGSPSYGNLGATLGLSYFPGRAGGAGPGADDDADGVRNGDDACPGTAPGATVDGIGCVRRRDTDGDGVIDINDACPATPAGDKVDANGCSAGKAREPGAASAGGY